MIIALDGPAASGKGTLAKKLAAHYGLPHLDTGLLYRAVGRAWLPHADTPQAAQKAAELAAGLALDGLDPDALASAEIGQAASQVAAIPAVRKALFDLQRRFAAQPGGAILDGRDIGTVICPHADVKLYVTATPEARARRRTDQLLGAGTWVTFEQVLDDIRRRDARDMGRADAPLRPAQDAHLLDTSEMDIEAAFRAATAIIEQARAGTGGR